jgi:hypothetical protein
MSTGPFDYRARDAEALLAGMRARIPALLPEWTGYESETDMGTVLLELFAHMGDVLGYYIDAAANESFLATAQTRRSVIDHLRLIGYRLATAAPATTELALTVPAPCTGPVTIRRGDAFTTRSTADTPSVRFEYSGTDDLVIACTDFTATPGGKLRANTRIPVVEGRLISEVLGVSDGTAGQRFPLTRLRLILRPGTTDLEVVSEAGGVRTVWTVRETLAFSGPADTDVVVEIDAGDRAEVVFGPAVPVAQATVSATYRVGGGSQGNVAPGTIATIAAAPELTLRAATVVNESAATGGAEREGVEHAADVAPRVFRSLGRAVTAADFEALAAVFGGVGKVRATAQGWNTVTLFVAPRGGGTVSDVLAADLITYFEDKRPLSTRVEIRDVDYVPVFLTVEVDVEPYQSRVQVTGQVRDRIAALLAFDEVDFGAVVYLSKFYEAAESVAGVAGVNVSEFRIPGQDTPVHPQGKLVLGARELPRLPAVDDFARHPDGAPASDYPGGIRITAVGGF